VLVAEIGRARSDEPGESVDQLARLIEVKLLSWIVCQAAFHGSGAEEMHGDGVDDLDRRNIGDIPRRIVLMGVAGFRMILLAH